MEDQERKEITKQKLKPHPKEKSNFLSHFFFWWELPIIVRGWKREITEDDLLYIPLEEYKSEELGNSLEKLWLEEEYSQKHPSLARALFKLLGTRYILIGLIYLPAELLFTFLQPYYLLKLLDYFSPNHVMSSRNEGYIYAAILSLLCICRTLSFHTFVMSCSVMGIKARVSCSSLIYRRILKMSKGSLEKITTGRIVNLMSNDIARLEQVFMNLHFIWIGPLELILGICYIDITLGHAAVTGVVVILVGLFFQSDICDIISLILYLILVFISKSLTKIRNEVSRKTDQRICLMNDIINGIQTIKVYTWEKTYTNLVQIIRRLEMKFIEKANHIRLFNSALIIYISKVCMFFSVLADILTDTPLTPQFIFVLYCIYEILKNTIIIFFPQGIIMLAESITSIKRLQEFLLNDDKSSNFRKNVTTSSIKKGIFLKSINVKWNPSTKNNVLENLSLHATSGELIGVIGSAGSGKSTLIQTLLREVLPIGGNFELGGTISYATQDPWIFSSSIKQNIIFGENFDLDKYLKIIKMCGLQRDLILFPHGDQTLVGERGVMLSGGQKARVNLARAIYKDADIYLFDDPLSAIDIHVGKHILEECILGHLQKKCVLLVTHQTHYLKDATRIYKLESGKVVKCGTYNEVISTKEASKTSKTTTSDESHETFIEKHDLLAETKEHRSFGNTSFKIYKSYCLAAGGWCVILGVLLFYIINFTFVFLQDVIVTLWVNYKQGEIDPNYNNFLYAYTALTITTVLITHVGVHVFTKTSSRSSKNLHNNMFSKVTHATLTFYNHNASGRILNRFSKDIGTIDEILPTFLLNGLAVLLTAAFIIIIINIINYWMIFPTIVVMAIVVFFYLVFQPTNRNIKRTEGVTRSFFYAHIFSSLQGLVTIRARNMQDKLINEFDNHQDLYSSSSYIFRATFTAFGFWTDFVSVVYIILVIFNFFLIKTETTPGNVGLSIAQSLLLLGLIQFGMKSWGELDAQMTSVERVVEYAELDCETDTGNIIPPKTWPERGNITFNSVSLKYSTNNPLVLKQVSFDVKSGEKIGIVGRTGAGKTSLISVLFRLFNFEGLVTIDGVNTKLIPLNILRSKISIIPQVPVLFLGTLRKNIDPANEYKDEQIWNALNDLNLKEIVANLPAGLESMVLEEGRNFSVGQRQLLCLLRAILKNNKIIVLDEATANVDLETDSLIQSIIRKKFRDCTVLTIAHRLNTVIDSDKILVIEDGSVVEFESPDRLLKNSRGVFLSYVSKHGLLLNGTK